jgi:hypothetical protein
MNAKLQNVVGKPQEPIMHLETGTLRTTLQSIPDDDSSPVCSGLLDLLLTPRSTPDSPVYSGLPSLLRTPQCASDSSSIDIFTYQVPGTQKIWAACPTRMIFAVLESFPCHFARC